MSQRLFKVINNFVAKNADYSFDDLKEFIDEQVTNDSPQPRTISTRYSLVKKFLRDNYPQITEKQLKAIRPDDEITNSIIEQNDIIRSHKNNIKFDKELVDKILSFKDTEDLFELAIYLQFISGRRADEIRDAEYKIRIDQKDNLKMLLSKKSKDKRNKYFPIKLIKNSLSPKQFKESVKIIRQNFNYIKSNDYIKRLNRKIKKLVRNDLTSHDLRGMYAMYMFNTDNPENRNVNGFLSSVLNHDSDSSSLSYSNYIYEDGFKNDESKSIAEIVQKEVL
jgi:integrase